MVTFPRANLAPCIKIDEHILLAIRPEHVRFAGAGLAGEIADATFLGDRSHFHVRIAERSELVAVSGGTAPDGKAVHLAFAPEKLIGLPSDSSIAMGGLDPHIKNPNRNSIRLVWMASSRPAM